MENKWFINPVVIRNTPENRKALIGMGYKSDRYNNDNDVNIVTGADIFFTTNSNTKKLDNFSFPVWDDTVDCRNDDLLGLALAGRTSDELIKKEE